MSDEVARALREGYEAGLRDAQNVIRTWREEEIRPNATRMLHVLEMVEYSVQSWRAGVPLYPEKDDGFSSMYRRAAKQDEP